MEKPLATNLPADLPTNWQNNQVVAPVGTDAGLTTQHGYNYQSKQINDAHTAINNINEAFANIQELLTKAENTSTVAATDIIPVIEGSTSSQKKTTLATLISFIRTQLTAVYAALDHAHGNITKDGKIGTAADKAVFTTANGVLGAGTLPIAAGGTGGTTVAAARNALGLGNTNGALPVANGGTGATTAAAALTNLGLTATAQELNYIKGVKSGVQEQLDGKQPTITGAASSVAANNLTQGRVVVTDSNGKISVSSITTALLSFLSGLTSNIQEQLDDKAPNEHTHSADNIISGILPITRGGTGAANKEVANKNLIVYANLDSAPPTDLPASYPEGIYVYIETPLSKLPFRPSSYGLLVSFKSQAEVAQIWFTQPFGQTFTRGGNGVGWNASQAVPTNRGWVNIGQQINAASVE